MKNFTIVLLSIVLLFAACKEKDTTTTYTNGGEATLTKYSASDFTKNDIAEYNKLQYYLMLERLYAKVADSTITAYNDEGLTEKLTPVEFNAKHSTMQMVQAPNPEFPNDPYDLIDTLIFSPVQMGELKGLNINKENNLFVFEVADTSKVYFKWSEASSIFNAEQLALVDLFLATQKGLISYQSLKELGESTFAKMAQQLYSWGTEKGSFETDLEVYETFKFDKKYTKQEAKKIGGINEGFSMPNPDNLDDPTDIIDSIKYTPFNPDSIERLRTYFVWQSDDELNTVIKTLAYAPLYRPISSGYKLPPTPLFLLKAEDVKQKQNDAEKAFITYFTMALTRNAGTFKTAYGKEIFQGTEYLE